MKKVTIQVFTFDELSEDAKQTAINQKRGEYEEYNDFPLWAIDDCALLEPKEADLEATIGEDYKFPLLKNTRKNLFFSCDRDRFIDISNAMEVTNENHFLLWLEIPENLHGEIYFTVGKDTIIFEENDCNHEFTENEILILENGKQKFEQHCEDILKNIESGIDYRFTDEAITEDILANEYEFTKEGNNFNY
jgi:hypothetical protein